MPKRKTKPTAPTLVYVSEESMIGGVNRVVALQLMLKSRAVALAEKIAELKGAFDKDPEIVAARAELASCENSVQLYCVTHRDDLFTGEKKSKDYALAVVGFRKSPHSVGKVLSKDTWEDIAGRAEETEVLQQYVIWTASLDKDALLRNREELTAKHTGDLATAGLKFEQDETFFIQPKEDQADRITKPAEAAAA